MAASASPVPTDATASAKRLTLIATILGSSIAILDSSVVSVALPSIQRSLGGGLAGQQWVTNAYLLTLGSLILLGGSLGDIFGERRIFALDRPSIRLTLRGGHRRLSGRVRVLIRTSRDRGLHGPHRGAAARRSNPGIP